MSGVECCGEIRKSPYCPQCGSKLHQSGLDGLIMHIENNINRLSKELQRKKEKHFHPARIQQIEKTLAKWKSWKDAVDTPGL